VTKMRQQQKWQEILHPILDNTPFELVGVECTGGGKHTVVRVFIDKPGGITLDEIVSLTKSINVILDVDAPIQGLYTLEVSSPGVNRPLFLPPHFMAQIGQQAAFRITPARDGRQNYKGLIKSANEQGIEFEVEGEVLSFDYDEIENAKLIVDILKKETR